MLWAALCCFCGFQLLSSILLRLPSIWSARVLSKKLQSVRTIAHRGCRYEGTEPENTLPAFAVALKNKVDLIELDVWLTEDGEVVVFHDGSFQRMCRTEGHVTSTRYSELPLAYASGNNNGGSRNWLEEGSSDRAERIPLFSEVLELVPDTFPMIIEFKQVASCLFTVRIQWNIMFVTHFSHPAV
jgi:glycerophosphoryl diester phosphodiesterase